MLQQKCCCSLCVVQPVDVPKLTSGVQVTLLPLLLCCLPFVLARLPRRVRGSRP